MEAVAELLQDGLNWVAAQPPGILGLIAVVCVIIFLARRVFY